MYTTHTKFPYTTFKIWRITMILFILLFFCAILNNITGIVNIPHKLQNSLVMADINTSIKYYKTIQDARQYILNILSLANNTNFTQPIQ
jgi:hypothetical protein